MIGFFVLSFCSLIFIGIGIYAMRREKPMWFYSGDDEEIEKETFYDVKEYNRKNGVMWITYGIITMIPPLLMSIFKLNEFVFVIMMIGTFVFGMIIMMLYWNHLHDRYTKKK